MQRELRRAVHLEGTFIIIIINLLLLLRNSLSSDGGLGGQPAPVLTGDSGDSAAPAGVTGPSRAPDREAHSGPSCSEFRAASAPACPREGTVRARLT